ncbi:hypothetical protein [Novosphingobium sp. 9]|uniref:hypothetical protein n=1 Tax=Novosphingobium sp. 9 TaxID=2025349 RepID=UPI0021B54578|nr:hypothetical protein [Novosphingobium sp. 9]
MTDETNNSPTNDSPTGHDPERRPNRAGCLILALGGLVLFLVIAIPMASKFAG